MPLSSLNGQNLITEFEKYSGDTTELSSSDELILVNKIYRFILAYKQWAFLLKDSGDLTIQNDGTTFWVNLPSDFSYIPITSGDTNTGTYGLDKTIYTVDGNGNYYPYKIVNFTDRREYKNQDQYAYIDLANSRIVFTFPPVNTICNFDYMYDPADITLSTYPVFPAKFHYMIVHSMQLDDYMIQIFDKFRSYSDQNKDSYEKYLDSMSNWDSQFFAQ